ncbi:Class I SAM-dependent methyltransferase [Azospirillaceae bacterium]
MKEDTSCFVETACGLVRVVPRKCPLCGADNIHTPTNEQLSSPPWRVISCRNCGFTHLHQAPLYDALYSTLAWEKTTRLEEQRRSEIRPFSYPISKATRFRMGLLPRRKVADMVNGQARPGPVLDLGCGDGHHLLTLNSEYIPYGIEISAAIAARAAEALATRGGQAINASCLEGITHFPDKFFTAAILRSYLEHELKPAEVLKALHRVLQPEGTLFIKVPNFGCWQRNLMGVRWCGFRFPDHVNYFTASTLKSMGEMCGYQVRFGVLDRLPTSDSLYATMIRKSPPRQLP